MVASQPRVAFMQVTAALGIQLAFTSYNSPKGNADTERFMRTIKEELAWLRKWPSQTSLTKALHKLDQALQLRLSPLYPRLQTARDFRAKLFHQPQPRGSLKSRLLGSGFIL